VAGLNIMWCVAHWVVKYVHASATSPFSRVANIPLLTAMHMKKKRKRHGQPLQSVIEPLHSLIKPTASASRPFTFHVNARLLIPTVAGAQSRRAHCVGNNSKLGLDLLPGTLDHRHVMVRRQCSRLPTAYSSLLVGKRHRRL
jgi:hypothetical protein